MKYIPSIAFEEMSGSAKGVTAAKVKAASSSGTAAMVAASAPLTRHATKA